VSLDAHARELLKGIADQLFAEISEFAPQADIAKGTDGGVLIYRASPSKGRLRMTVGQHRAIAKLTFGQAQWDVISGDAILVSSPNYTRSASLWYADVGRKGQYCWIEMAYWPLGGVANGIPTHLEPGRDANLAASQVMHNWKLAHPVRTIDGDGIEDFCQRWMNFFGLAVAGKLRYPSVLPEPS